MIYPKNGQCQKTQGPVSEACAYANALSRRTYVFILYTKKVDLGGGCELYGRTRPQDLPFCKKHWKTRGIYIICLWLRRRLFYIDLLVFSWRDAWGKHFFLEEKFFSSVIEDWRLKNARQVFWPFFDHLGFGSPRREEKKFSSRKNFFPPSSGTRPMIEEWQKDLPCILQSSIFKQGDFENFEKKSKFGG